LTQNREGGGRSKEARSNAETVAGPRITGVKTMIFYIIGVVVVVIFVAGYLGVHI
jgi:hypothetical protein